MMSSSMHARWSQYRQQAIRIVLAAALGLVVGSSALAAGSYSVTVLGVLPGYDHGYGNSVNNAGVAVGHSADIGADGLFSASAGTYWATGQAAQALGPAPGFVFSSLASLNNRGEAVVSNSNINAGQASGNAALVWSPKTGTRALPSPAGAVFTTVTGLNDSGQAVGWADFATSRAGLVWSDNGELTVLPSLGEGVQVSSQRINNSGEVLVAGAGNGRQLSYVWDAARGYRQLAQPVGMHDSYGYDINDAGQVVGIAASSLSDGSPYHAVLWSGLNDALDLGGLPGATNNYAMAINAASAVVGQSWEAAGIRSFIWTASEGMRNLALLIDGVDPLAGRLGSLAVRDINDGGQILGSALIDGQRRALLLSPVPESGTALMLAMGLTAVACIVRRREAVGCRHRAPNRKCEQALVKARTAAWIFLNRLPVANCAVKLSNLITDNGSQFADRFTSRKRAPKGRLKLYEVPIPPDC